MPRGALIGLGAVVLLALLAIAAVAPRVLREGLAFPPFVDALGYQTPVPGDPDRNILRRSEPYPPGRYPYGGLSSYYFQSDPAKYSSYENDACVLNPAACAGFALDRYTAR